MFLLISSFISIREILRTKSCLKWSPHLKETLKHGHYKKASAAFLKVYCNSTTNPKCEAEGLFEWANLPLETLYKSGRRQFCSLICDDSSENVDPYHHRCNWCRSTIILFDKWIKRMDKEMWANEVSDYCHVSAKYFGKELCQSVAKLYADGKNQHGTMCDDQKFC